MPSARHRIVEVSTVFGKDKMHLQHLSGSEELGRPFRFELELLCDDMDLKLDDQVGSGITVSFVMRNQTRYLHGLVSQMSYAGTLGQQARYIAILRPRLWFLGHSSGNRVFQKKTVPDIVKQVFGDHGHSAYSTRLSASYRTREYCVQYGETDFDFVSRLLEEEGIYYYFEHKDGQHTLVLTDSYSGHSAAAEYNEVEFFPPGSANTEIDHVSDWECAHRVETQKYKLASYDYEKPSTALAGDATIKRDHALSGLRRYDYGQLYPEKKDGDSLAKVRVQEQQVSYAVASATSNVRGLGAGMLFNLKDHPRKDQNAEYLVIGAAYDIDNSEMESGRATSDPEFRCSFDAITAKTPFRPARVTPKSIVRGPQTAVVVGPSKEEIWTDKLGRVKVQFHWDEVGKKDENSSCWVRVSTALAGQNWGFVAIPRIGQEVIVDFLEGDPDQPIITGSVYNEANKPPYDLPGNQTQSGLKTRSSKDGTAKNFNELRFEDKKGEEEVFFHAEKNFNRVVKNNDTLKVGLETKDKGDQTIEIHNDRTATLNEGTDKLTVKKGNQNIEITKGDQTLDVKAGNQKIDVKKKIEIIAGDELSIKVGQASLVMKKNGDVTIKGMNLTFKATNSVTVKATNTVTVKGSAKVDVSGAQVQIAGQAKTDVKGAMTKVEGSAMLDLNAGGMAKLKGGVTMIG